MPNKASRAKRHERPRPTDRPRPRTSAHVIPCVLNSIAERIKKESRPLILGILEKLDPVIADAMSAVESSNREIAERHGVSYNPMQDQVLNGLAAFREVAHNRLDNEFVPLHPNQLERFLGVLKPKKAGIFS